MRKIAIIFGGHSTEYEVSLQSAAAVFENINTEEFEVFRLESRKRVTGITTPESFQRSRQAHGVMMLLI